MKRGREDGCSSEAAITVQFELIHGLTHARSETHANSMHAAHARLMCSHPQNRDGVDLAVLLTNTAHPWLAGPERVLTALLANREDGDRHYYSDDLAEAAAPPMVRTVQLVANDGEMLIFAVGDNSNGSGASAAPASVAVPQAVGEHVYPGDVVLVTSSLSTCTVSAEADGLHVSTTLCGLDASVFDDAETWKDAVASNVVAATRWVSALCAQTPGLPQLAFMEACRLGRAGTVAQGDGWTRVLQLPLLMQVRRPLVGGLDRGTVDGLHRVTLSLLSTLLAVLRHSEAIMSLPDLHRELVLAVLASPLYAEGLTSTLLRAADTLGATAWQNASACVAAALELAAVHVCQTPSPTTSACVSSAAATSALGSVEVVLCRLSDAWLSYAKKAHEMRRHGQQQVPNQLRSEQRVHDMLGELAASNAFEPAARWLRQRDVADGDTADAAAGLTPLSRMGQPPALRHLEALAESSGAVAAAGGSVLRRSVVAEQLATMRRTYTPYVGRDALRFVEAAATAAHSELFGPASRAVCEVLSHADTSLEDDPTPAQRLRVTSAVFRAPRAGGFSSYSLSEVRHIAAYGLPVELTLSPPVVEPELDEEEEGEIEAERVVAAAAAAEAVAEEAEEYLYDCLERRHGGSCFCFVLVRIQGEPAVFPLLATTVAPREGDATDAASAVKVVAYAMRDADLLPQFLRTSAALEEDGLPDAWLLTGFDPCDGHNGYGSDGEEDAEDEDDESERGLGASGVRSGLEGPRARLLPAGTPALTYLDLLERLSFTRRELRGELPTTSTGNSSSISTFPSSSSLPASSMWVRYVATGEPPMQVGFSSLSATAAAIATGTGSVGKETSGRLLREATDAAPLLTPAQTEALYALASGAAPTGTGSGGGSATPLSSLRLVEGAVGSGKTATLCAAGAARGRVLAAARREHQASLHPIVSETTMRVRRCHTRAEAATTLADVLPTTGEAKSGSNGGDSVATVGLVESLATAVEDQLVEYSRLSRGAQFCTAPLLVRCGQCATHHIHTIHEDSRASDCEGVPVSTRGLVFAETSTTPASVVTVAQLLEAALQRSQRSPLALQLAAVLAQVKDAGDALTAFVASGADAASVDVVLLPLLLAAREVHEIAAAAAVAKSRGSETSWPAYLRDTLWRAVAAHERNVNQPPHSTVTRTALRVASSDDDRRPVAVATPKGVWAPPAPPAAGAAAFTPVQMPATTHLPALSADQAAGWHTVCVQKQSEVVPLLLSHLHATVRHAFQVLLDITYGVAAIAQVGRHDLVTLTDGDLLRGTCVLPLLWRWRPSHVFVDDFTVMRDGVLLALPPSNALSLSLSTEVPMFVERHLHAAPMAVLRALRQQLQSTSALTTASLHETLRNTRPELNAALAEMCVGSSRDAGDAPFAALVHRTGADGAKDSEGEDEDGPPRAVAEIPVAQPCFPGFASFSALELWTHAVPVHTAARADQCAALFLCERLLMYEASAAAGTAGGGRSGAPFSSAYSVEVCFPCAVEAEAFARSVESVPQLRRRVSAAWVPFSGRGALRLTTTTNMTAGGVSEETERECSVVVLCVSSLVPPPAHDGRGRGNTQQQQQQHRKKGAANESRAAQWKALLATPQTVSGDDSPTAFGERMQWWWWRAARRAREGVIVVASEEFALHVPMFRYFERYVAQLRQQLAPARHLRYWLPPAAACAVLALNCPEHHRCRRTATVAAIADPARREDPNEENEDDGRRSDGEEGAEDMGDRRERSLHSSSGEVTVVVRGASTCVSLCLKPFAHCEARAHACLRPCHIERSVEDGDGEDIRAENRHNSSLDIKENHHDPDACVHAHCPYPCGKRLACGHICDKTCGEDCGLCSFTGLTELPCGQRVVSGTGGVERGVSYERVPHFQEARCGAPLRPCVEPVTARCPRCGTRSTVPCFQLTAHESRIAQAHRDANHGSGVKKKETPVEMRSDDPADFLLADGECPGCVAVYNRVAAKFGYDELPAPMVVKRLNEEPPGEAPRLHTVDDEGAEENEADLCALRERATLPRHALSPDAQVELRKAFTVAAKRSELLLMKEALEVSNGSAPDTSETIVQRRYCEQNRARQQRQIEERQEALKVEMVEWAQRLRGEFTKQSDVASRLAAMMPQLVSEAREEASRQRRYGF